MTEPAPTQYPGGWHPKWAPPQDSPPEPIQPSLQMDLAAAAMTDDEWTAFVRRARGSRS
jgi:hypothetical protein